MCHFNLLTSSSTLAENKEIASMKPEDMRAKVQLTETSAAAKLHWHFSSSTPKPQVLSCHTPVTAFAKRFDQNHLPDFSDSPTVTVQDLLSPKPHRALNLLTTGFCHLF